MFLVKVSWGASPFGARWLTSKISESFVIHSLPQQALHLSHWTSSWNIICCVPLLDQHQQNDHSFPAQIHWLEFQIDNFLVSSTVSRHLWRNSVIERKILPIHRTLPSHSFNHNTLEVLSHSVALHLAVVFLHREISAIQVLLISFQVVEMAANAPKEVLIECFKYLSALDLCQSVCRVNKWWSRWAQSIMRKCPMFLKDISDWLVVETPMSDTIGVKEDHNTKFE